MNIATLQSYFSIAQEAARFAGEYIVDSSKNLSNITVEQKTPRDYVSEVDRQSEKIIREYILTQFPEHVFLGEESGLTKSTDAERNEDMVTWVVDPLDGTTNFVRGIAHYAVSIAAIQQGVVMLGLVFDPVKNEMFSALRGQGALLNGQGINVTASKSFEGALLATGVPFSGVCLDELGSFQSTMKALLEKKTSGIRRLGAAALDLAYVASGRYDGFWEAHLKPWDIAAGALLVEEAGGRVASFSGQQNFLDCGDIVAGNEAVFSEISRCVRNSYQRDYY